MNKEKKVLSVILTIIILASALPGEIIAQSGGVAPGSKTVESEENFVISVSFSNVNDLYAVNFDLRFDNSVLKFTHAERGAAMLLGCSSGMLATSTRANGDVYIYADRGSCDGRDITDETAAVNLHFTALATGTTALEFTNENVPDFPKLTNKANETISMVWENGTVNVVADLTPPVITLLGDNPVNIALNSAYTDAGATAFDNFDGDLTGQIITVNPVNISVAGTYTVTYNVADSAGNAADEVTRTVNVLALPVTVTLTPSNTTVTIGDSFDLVLSVNNITDLGSIIAEIAYDDNVLEFTDADFTDFLNICPAVDPLDEPSADELESGTVLIFANCWDGASGDQAVIATLSFNTLATSTDSEILFSFTELSDTGFNPIDHEAAGAGVGVHIPYATADLNRDGVVNSVDAGILMSNWGSTARPLADINQDGYVNSVDAGIMMSQWSK